MTRIQIINETVEWYKNNPRSTSQGRCKYLSPNGAMCAVGRCLTPDALVFAVGTDKDGETRNTLSFEDLEAAYINAAGGELFKKEYIDHDEEFWMDLQDLHDTNGFWMGSELTSLGQSKVERLLQSYS